MHTGVAWKNLRSIRPSLFIHCYSSCAEAHVLNKVPLCMDSFTANNKEQLVYLSAGALRRAKPSVVVCSVPKEF